MHSKQLAEQFFNVPDSNVCPLTSVAFISITPSFWVLMSNIGGSSLLSALLVDLDYSTGTGLAFFTTTTILAFPSASFTKDR